MKLDPYKDSYQKLVSIYPVKYQATRNYIPNSLKLKKEISEELINSNIIFFKNEMMDIKLHKESTFVILGGLTAYYFDTYFKKHFNNKVIYFDHYSAYAKYTDISWAEEFLKKIKS